MIKIKAPINFNIVEQIDNGTSLEYIYEGYEPTEVTCTNNSQAQMLQTVIADIRLLRCSPWMVEHYGDLLDALEYEQIAQKALLEREAELMDVMLEIEATDAEYKLLFRPVPDKEASA